MNILAAHGVRLSGSFLVKLVMPTGRGPYGTSRRSTQQKMLLAQVDVPLRVRSGPRGLNAPKRLRLSAYSRMVQKGYERVGECFVFLGRKNSRGYGEVTASPGSRSGYALAHVVSFEKWYGPVPAGLVVDHVCHNEAAWAGLCAGGVCIHRACINPVHLRAITLAENFAASPLTGRRQQK